MPIEHLPVDRKTANILGDASDVSGPVMTHAMQLFLDHCEEHDVDPGIATGALSVFMLCSIIRLSVMTTGAEADQMEDGAIERIAMVLQKHITKVADGIATQILGPEENLTDEEHAAIKARMKRERDIERGDYQRDVAKDERSKRT
jgi:hypothetical protein